MMADKSTKKVSLSTSLQGKDKKYSNHLKSNSTANVSWPFFTLCFGIGIVFHTRIERAKNYLFYVSAFSLQILPTP